MANKIVFYGAAALLAATVAVQGCGGGTMTTGGTGGATGGSGSFLGGASASALATTFQVNVNTGNVSIVSQRGSLPGQSKLKPGMFTGNTIGFTSSVLTNDSLGGTGVRSVQVSLVNNTDLTLGVSPSGATTGLNVIFGAFANTTGVQSQAVNTTVSTFSGSTAGYADGALAAAQFKEPTGSAVGADGSVYVADFGNGRVRKINSGFVSTLAGSGAAAEADGAATKASFHGPYGLAVNPVDNSVIVADLNGDTIRRITQAGAVNTIAGTANTAGSANGAGNAATFTSPVAVAVDSGGNIYVSEASSNRIRKIVLVGNPGVSSNYTVSTMAGSGAAGFQDGTGTGATFNAPYGLATDSSGNVYVADASNNAIRMISPTGNVITIAGTGVASDLDAYGNVATFDHPVGIAFLNGALYVCESTGSRIREVMPVPGGGNSSSSWLVETLAGTGSTGDANGQGSASTFSTPLYLGASAQSSLYVADFGNNQLRRINPSSGTFPIGTPTGSTNSTTPVTLSNPSGVDNSSDLGQQSPFVTYSGALGPGQTSQPANWNFTIPNGVTSFQFQVIVEANTSQSLTLQANIGAGSPLVDVRSFAGNFTVGGSANGTVTDALFSSNGSLAFDGYGVLYDSDSGNSEIRRIDTSGNVTTIAGSPSLGSGYANGAGNVAQFDEPESLAVNSEGTEVFVADFQNNIIRRIALTSGADPTNPANWTVSLVAGQKGTAAETDGVGTTAAFQAPYGIAIRPGGDLFVSDFGGQRIRLVTYTGGDRSLSSDWYVQSVAGSAVGFANGQGASASFNHPTGICCDSYGNLYIADYENNAVREMSTAYTVSTYAGLGPTGSGYVDGPATSAKFDSPIAVSVDASGYVYVADQFNSVIRRISPGVSPSSVSVATVAGIDNVDGNGNGPGSTALFDFPNSVAISPSGSLFITENAYDIREIQDVVNTPSGAARPK